MGSSWIQEKFPEHWFSYHITLLEIYPIFVLLFVFAKKLVNATITFHCDNEAVVTILNKQTSKNKLVMHVVRAIVCLQLQHNFCLKGRHIPGQANTLADNLSRFQVSSAMLQQYGMQEIKTSVPAHLLPENFYFNSKTCLVNLCNPPQPRPTSTTGTTSSAS